MRALIMGGTGFLGRRVAKKLAQKGIDYISFSQSTGVDFTNYHEFFNAIKNTSSHFDVIINCAALVGGIKYGLEHTGEMYYVNSLISLNLYEIARHYNIKKIINPISNCSYPRDLVGQFSENQWWDGILDDSVATYGMVRKMSYIQSVAYYKQYGIHTANLIIPNMYGPEDHFDEVRSHALGALIKKINLAKIKNESQVIVWGTGSPVREWLYVDDCAEAIYRSLKGIETMDPINVGCGKGISIKDLAEMIADIIGYKGELYFDASKPDGAPYKVMDVTRCHQYFNWLPEMSIQNGIQRSVEWLNAKSEQFA